MQGVWWTKGWCFVAMKEGVWEGEKKVCKEKNYLSNLILKKEKESVLSKKGVHIKVSHVGSTVRH